MGEENQYRGKILISNSVIMSDEFNQSVVFMIEHDSSGAFGLVVNKKSTYLLNEVVLGLPQSISAEIPMYWGGPVDHNFITILHNNSFLSDPGLEVLEGVFLSRSFELLMKLLDSPESIFHVFHGYSGWGPGQLEAEFERKSWVLHEARPAFLLNEEPESVWREALRSKGGIYKYFAEHTKDPLMN
jgi:putative transcriptional regulator